MLTLHVISLYMYYTLGPKYMYNYLFTSLENGSFCLVNEWIKHNKAKIENKLSFKTVSGVHKIGGSPKIELIENIENESNKVNQHYQNTRKLQ